MSTITKSKKIAQLQFVNRDYEKALFNYSIALQKSPKDDEARLGAILSDLAMDSEDEAQALFDYYTVIKDEDESEAIKVVQQIIDSIDNGLDSLSHIISKALSKRVDNMDGVSYEEFKILITKRGFVEIFESIMFSTKVIISNKNDFFEFIELLIEYEYKDMALNYIESASSAYAHEEKFAQILKKLEN